MVKAARRAGRSLKRDLGEVENLQVSLKGTAISSPWPIAAPGDVCTPTSPRQGRATAHRRGRRQPRRRRQEPHLDCRSARRHHDFLHGIPQFAISIGLQREGTMIAGLIYNPAMTPLTSRARQGRLPQRSARLRVAGRRNLGDCVIACGLPHIGRGDHDLSREEMTEIQKQVAGLRRFGAARSIWLSSRRAARRLLGAQLSPWDMAAGQIIVREAGGTVSGVEGDDDPLKTGNLICGQ